MRALKGTGLALASVAALAAVRFLALGADPPPWLSWSGGLHTDEGFYTLDARHMVLFGIWARGNFHDRLLSPLLSLMQQSVFHLFGPSLITARALSAVLGLLTVGLLWLALRACFGLAAANAGALLLGFAPPFVLYNRLALQETPAVFCLTLSFALWAWGVKWPPPTMSRIRTGGTLLLLAGVMAGAALLCKSLTVVFLPALCWLAWKSGRRGTLVVCGLVLVLAPWLALCYAPHHSDIARMGAYYQKHQFLPHTPHSLWLNIRRAGVGDRAGVLRGLLPYLLLFVPVPCALVLNRAWGWQAKPPAEQALWLWLAGGALFCAVSSYAPDRYYVLFLPPLCGLAGIGWAALSPARRWASGLLCGVVSAVWLGAAWHGLTWNAARNARTLAHLLPPRSVVIGDMAPALALGTTLDAAPVQAGLSNSIWPVETLGASDIATTRAPVYTQWWQKRYPKIVRPEHHLAAFAVGPHAIVDIYRVRP